MLVRALFGSLLFSLIALPLHAPAQSPSQPPPADSQTPILQLSTRVVLTDVTVTDDNGNPIHGLARTDFHVFDDNHPQPLASFIEHTQAAAPETIAAPAASTISNDFLLHPPSPVNVILIDTTTIGLFDQMVLYNQLTRLVAHLPDSQPIAIYTRSGDATLLLQNFTSDHALLMAALRRAVPHFRSPDAPYTNDLDTLQQMAAYLRQIPGRKNLLWFSGGSLLFLSPDPSNPVDLPVQPDRRPLYDLLESERIAIYPIDARGLTVNSRPGIVFQQMQMQNDARATGGLAIYNTNGLATSAAHVIATDGDFYTLTYSPRDLHRDGKWHSVKVTVDNPHYHLSYRHGYFDDGQNNLPPPGKTRTMLRANGSTTEVPRDANEPIIFQARVLPAALLPLSVPSSPNFHPPVPRHGQVAYTVQFTLAASQLHPGTVEGNLAKDNLRSAVIAFDRYGSAVSRVIESATFTVHEDKLHDQPNALLSYDQPVNLPTGEVNLFVVLWDINSGRFGTVSVPLDVRKHPK